MGKEGFIKKYVSESKIAGISTIVIGLVCCFSTLFPLISGGILRHWNINFVTFWHYQG
jgi:hypothetical protein